MLLNSNIAYLRQKNNFSQIDLANVFEVSQRSISYYENGGREPSLDVLVNISNFFNVTVDDLLKKDLRKEEYGGNTNSKKTNSQ